MGAEPRAGGAEPLLVVILGPTASGKTALSLELARKFGGEIVNCDSVAMYREFDIGTAKPTSAERAQAPHHLFDCVDPSEDVTAGEYARQARQILAEISARHRLPIVVGGTGLYLRALLEGLFRGAAAVGGIAGAAEGAGGEPWIGTSAQDSSATGPGRGRASSCQRCAQADPRH